MHVRFAVYQLWRPLFLGVQYHHQSGLRSFLGICCTKYMIEVVKAAFDWADTLRLKPLLETASN